MLISPPRWLPMLVVGVLVAVGIGFVGWSLTHFAVNDADAYLAAADRLLHGDELYPVAPEPDSPLAYRGAPWFIALWIPLTFVPRLVVDVGWASVLLAASAWTVWPLLRERRAAAMGLAVLAFGLLFWTASRGNVHPLVMAALVHGAPRRSGPLWIAVAASLKAVPILFVLAYAARREWSRVALSLLLTALLVLPMPLMGWAPARTPAGSSLAIYYQVGPAAWATTAAVALVAAVAVAWLLPRYAWVASGAAAIIALPRLIFYDFTYVIVGADRHAVRR